MEPKYCTVKKLREILEKYPDDMPVVTLDDHGEYDMVESFITEEARLHNGVIWQDSTYTYDNLKDFKIVEVLVIE